MSLNASETFLFLIEMYNTWACIQLPITGTFQNLNEMYPYPKFKLANHEQA